MTVSPLRLGALALTALSAAACTPASVTSATNNFERATDVEFICLEFPSARPPAPGEDAGCLRNDAGVCVQQNVRRLFPYALPLSSCQINDANNTSTAVNRNLFALVTQSNRGELALVNLTTSSGTSLFDNSPGVPGYSFIPVGRSPTALVADVRTAPSENADAVSSVWIASAADKTVQRIDTRMLTLDPRTRQADGLRGSMRVNGALRDITLDAEPRDLAIDAVNGRQLLYVTLPSASAVAVYDITDPTNARPLERIAITAPPLSHDAGDAGSGGDASDATLDGGDAGDPDASLDGGDAGAPVDVLDAPPSPDREEVGTPDAAMDGGDPDGSAVDVPAGARARPSRLVVDRRTHTVYLNDESSSWVHILQGTPARVVDRIDVGVPTRALALSGWARASSATTDPDHSALAQYLYVVSATDGAVYAFDLVRRARVNANLLPAPNPLRRRLDPALPDHRVAVSFPATALLPISSREYTEPPEGDPPTISVPQACDVSGKNATGCRGDRGAVGPEYLHGVFMGVVLRDGRLSIIDIDDYDVPARVQVNAERMGGYRFIRHAPRLREPFQQTQAPGIRNAPTLTESPQDGQRVPVLESRRSPTISCVERRTADGANAPCRGSGLEYENYGVELVASPASTDGGTGDAAVDASDGASAASSTRADPYALRNETWALTYEETLPGLDLSGGAFSVNPGGELTLDQPGAAFCTRGTLGDDTARDLVEIVSDPTPLAANVARCADLFGPGATMSQRTYARNRTLQIARATQDRLTLNPLGDVAPGRFTECFPQATRFRVRAGGQWLVQGSVSGFVHSVRADSTGTCVIDDERQRLVESLAAQCLTRRAPPSMRASDWCGEGRSCRCPAGRACMGRPDSTGTITATTTPVFANPFFCLQVFPAILAYTGTRPCDPIGAQVSGPGQSPAWAVCNPGRDVRFTFAISGAWSPLDTGNTSGSFVTAARFLPTLDRLYVLDTQALGLVEFRTNPLARLRLFN